MLHSKPCSIAELASPEPKNTFKRRGANDDGGMTNVLQRLSELEAYKKMIDDVNAQRDAAERARDAAEAKLAEYMNAAASPMRPNGCKQMQDGCQQVSRDGCHSLTHSVAVPCLTTFSVAVVSLIGKASAAQQPLLKTPFKTPAKDIRQLV